MSIRQKTVQALAMAGVIAMVLFLAGCGGGGGGSSSSMMMEDPMDTTPPTPDPMNDATTRDDEMLELFMQANGMDEEFMAIEDDPDTMDVDESMTVAQQQMAEAMLFGAALAAAADRNNGKPTLFVSDGGTGGNLNNLNPTPTATWAADSQLQITIDRPAGETFYEMLTTGLDDQGDPMNFKRIDGLGDFMHGFEIERMGVGDAAPLDQAKAIVFTDKQQDDPAIAGATMVDAGSFTNHPVGTGVVMFDVSDVSDDPSTISNVMYFESSNTVDDPGTAYMGMLTCPALTSCNYEVAANGDITITGYQFTGTREHRAMVTEVTAEEQAELNNDYLVFGLWLNENNEGEWESFGAIAGGGDMITGDDLTALDSLTGQATYTGKAFGAHHMGGMTSWFDADASIMIDWDASTNTSWGTVMGEISNIRIAGGAMHGDSIYLSANGGDNVPTFTGTAAMGEESRPNAGDYPFSGGWAGSLYSPGASGEAPDAVAGTFGVTNMDETETFVGAFGARRMQ